MPYATVPDMITAFGEVEMIRLSTPENDDVDGVVVDRVESVLSGASSLADSYLMRRYAVPLPVVPAALKDCVLALARYSLMFQGGRDPTEQARLARKDWVTWLQGIAEGTVTLDGVEPIATGAGAAEQLHGARVQDRAGPFQAGGPLAW